eukprot:10966556-Alexandrium_andersonii.AAC.1
MLRLLIQLLAARDYAVHLPTSNNRVSWWVYDMGVDCACGGEVQILVPVVVCGAAVRACLMLPHVGPMKRSQSVARGPGSDQKVCCAS